jgi:hypothetical protein
MTGRRTKVLVWGVALVAVLAGESGAAGAKRGRKLPPDVRIPRVKATLTASRGRLPMVVGTLQYDNNVPFRRDPATDNVIGNQFLGGDPHSIASVSFRVAQNYSGGVIVSAWNPDGMGGATRLFQQYVSGIPNGATMTVTMFTAMAPLTMALTGLNGPFIAGVHNTAFTGNGCPANSMLNGTCDGVALSAGTMDPGQGFHAFRIPLAGGTFIPPTTMVPGGVAAIPGVNALFRTTGDNLPVELMDLSVR